MEYLKCRIEPDYSWYQVDSHWEITRLLFDFIWEVGSSLSSPQFYYRIGTYSANIEDYTTILTPTKYNETKYLYTLDPELLGEEAKNNLYTKKCLTIYVSATDTDGDKQSTYSTLDLVFPPETLEKATLKKSSSTKYKCIWPQALKTGDDQPSVAGYGIELKERSSSSTKWTQIKGIKAELVNGKYWIVKDNAYFEDLDEEIPEYAEKTFLASAGMAYIKGQITTEAFFNPKELGLKKDCYYKFIVYPYNNYSTYYDDAGRPQPGTGLASEGTESNEIRYGGGTLRVKTADGWKEGQVWVYTSSGWKEATGVYVKTAKGWKESI